MNTLKNTLKKLSWKVILGILITLLIPAFYEGVILGKESLNVTSTFTQATTIIFTVLLIMLTVTGFIAAGINTIKKIKKIKKLKNE